MKKVILTFSMIMILFLITSFSNGYIRIFTPIKLSNVSQLNVESDLKEKYKIVKDEKDIKLIINFVNSLRFKDTNKVDYRPQVLRNFSGKLKEIKSNYRIIVIEKGKLPDWIIINILNDKEVYYRGRIYLVNKNVQKYVAEIYTNLKYMEYETIPRVRAVKVPIKNK